MDNHQNTKAPTKLRRRCDRKSTALRSQVDGVEIAETAEEETWESPKVLAFITWGGISNDV